MPEITNVSELLTASPQVVVEVADSLHAEVGHRGETCSLERVQLAVSLAAITLIDMEDEDAAKLEDPAHEEIDDRLHDIDIADVSTKIYRLAQELLQDEDLNAQIQPSVERQIAVVRNNQLAPAVWKRARDMLLHISN